MITKHQVKSLGFYHAIFLFCAVQSRNSNVMLGYSNELTLAEGLSQYLSIYKLGDGGYTDKWFKLKLFWKFGISLPNISNRVAAVKFHDLHHVLTEYSTGFRGEAEIGAWKREK